jgi:hypothetical protein|tara:strand:+ start:132 stop:731 length:600 start_codon:yes stop_codon:yes gene_type:complete
MNYGQIRTHFKALLNRSDITDALANTFIDQGIARIQRSLRIPSMEAQHTYSFTSATSKVTLPTNFLEAIDIYYLNRALTKLPMREMQQNIATGETGNPLFFSREGSSFLLHPKPTGGDLVLNYYALFTDLVADSDENILSQIAPDLLTYAALTYASDYYLDERSDIWESKYAAFGSEIQTQAFEQEQSGTLQQIRPAYT